MSKRDVTCIKSLRNLHQIALRFDSKSRVFWVKTQCNVNGFAIRELENHKITPVFLLFLFCLVTL